VLQAVSLFYRLWLDAGCAAVTDTTAAFFALTVSPLVEVTVTGVFQSEAGFSTIEACLFIFRQRRIL